jgi:L-asparaginase
MKKNLTPFFLFLVLSGLIFSERSQAQTKPRIAVFTGPTSTIQNSPPLVTSNKARDMRGLPLPKNADGSPTRYDHLVPQRLAAPVEVLIEQFSAHPLEKDAAHLYGAPDGYIDRNGVFHKARQNPGDKPAYRVTLRPEDGLYLLPYMSVQADGKPWDGNCTARGAPFEKCRQTFYPDPSRTFEEIDRTIVGRNENGVGNVLSSKADFDFYRAVPPGGYTKGLAMAQRTDVIGSDIPQERLGEDFFPYGPHRAETRLEDLARATNTVQRALKTGKYAGAIWLEGSPTVQETTYWLNLLIDTTMPITGNSSQRVHGMIGNEGDRNMIDSVDYIRSKVWADSEGRDSVGAVQLVDTQIFASRQVEKQGARPGGYVAMGGHGGILGTIGDPGPVTIWFKPTTLHTWGSAVNLTRLARTVQGMRKVDGKVTLVEVPIKDDQGYLRGEAIPKVTMVRHNRWIKDTAMANADEEPEIFARVEKNLRDRPLSGIVAEGSTPYGAMQESMEKALTIAVFSGLPVVRVSRGDTAGMVAVNADDIFIEGNNLTAGKARMLLMAALMKFGSLPPAADPKNPTPEEKKAVQEKIKEYQEVFNTH